MRGRLDLLEHRPPLLKKLLYLINILTISIFEPWERPSPGTEVAREARPRCAKWLRTFHRVPRLSSLVAWQQPRPWCAWNQPVGARGGRLGWQVGKRAEIDGEGRKSRRWVDSLKTKLNIEHFLVGWLGSPRPTPKSSLAEKCIHSSMSIEKSVTSTYSSACRNSPYEIWPSLA